MLGKDLKTIRDILSTKRLVKAYVLETAGWCRPGLWYVEGPYARHRDATLPDGLRDAIYGVWRRRAARKFVERMTPPWQAYVPRTVPAPSQRQCSIAYLSKGGDWKLFDLENQKIWTRPIHVETMDREIDNLKRFGAAFNIPAWYIVRDNETLWRSDEYICGLNLAHCTGRERIEIVRELLRQYGIFAETAAAPPNPELTQDAIRTMQECAPDSIPAQVARKYRAEMQFLGAALKLLPAHGDLSAQNVLVRDGQPWIIDWNTAGRYHPVLYDVLYLIVREAQLRRIDLLETFLQGCFDDGLCRMFDLTGLPPRICDNFVVLMHSYIVHFHYMRSAGQHDACGSNVDRLWNPLRAFCSDYV